MKNYFRLSALIVSTILASNLTHAQQDKNLIPVATAETSGYDTFNAYVLKKLYKAANFYFGSIQTSINRRFNNRNAAEC